MPPPLPPPLGDALPIGAKFLRASREVKSQNLLRASLVVVVVIVAGPTAAVVLAAAVISAACLDLSTGGAKVAFAKVVFGN